MKIRRVELKGRMKISFFAPVLCVFLMFLVVISSPILLHVEKDLRALGLILGISSAFLFWWSNRELEYTLIQTTQSPECNYDRILVLTEEFRWSIRTQTPGKFIQAIPPMHPYDTNGELVTVEFEGSNVYVNSISDPRSIFAAIHPQNRVNVEILSEALCAPNPPLKSDPACIASRSLSTFCYPGSVQRLGAGGAG